MWNDEDVKEHFRWGFWVGAISGSFITMAICLVLGLYLK